MAEKDYYLVLGISRTESPRGIQKAFRDLVRQHHPDRAGSEATPMFREVVEAYRVLSDPEQRLEHDAELGLRGPARHSVPHVELPIRRRTFGERAVFADPESIRPGAERLLSRFLANFGSSWAEPKSEHREPLRCDIVLTRAEALTGGILPIRIPVARPCPVCHGARRVAGFPCGRCDASGGSASEIVVPLELAPGIRSDAILDLPLDRWGIRNLWLRVRIRVG